MSHYSLLFCMRLMRGAAPWVWTRLYLKATVVVDLGLCCSPGLIWCGLLREARPWDIWNQKVIRVSTKNYLDRLKVILVLPDFFVVLSLFIIKKKTFLITYSWLQCNCSFVTHGEWQKELENQKTANAAKNLNWIAVNQHSAMCNLHMCAHCSKSPYFVQTVGSVDPHPTQTTNCINPIFY